MGEKLKRAGQSFVIVQYNYFGAFLLCISLVFFFAIFFSPDHLAMLAAFVISFGGGVWMLLVAQRKTDEINVQKSAEDKASREEKEKASKIADYMASMADDYLASKAAEEKAKNSRG